MKSIADVKAEIFGPGLQVMRWDGNAEDVIAQIKPLGYRLTLGIQTRIDSRARAAADYVGDIHVNRNMIGAAGGMRPCCRACTSRQADGQAGGRANCNYSFAHPVFAGASIASNAANTPSATMMLR